MFEAFICHPAECSPLHDSNHPVLKEDGLLFVFLTESSFETWRKHSSISLDEESASKRVDKIEEMSIPSDLEDKLTCGFLQLVCFFSSDTDFEQRREK